MDYYYLKDIKINKVTCLDIGAVWYDKRADVFQSNKVVGEECSYPLYKYNNFYSYSPLNLLKIKGVLDWNRRIEYYLEDHKIASYLPPEVFIDKKIKRVGSAINQEKLTIKSQKHFVSEFSNALIRDIRRLENLHSKSVFGILTGGKDSLNLLLFPWKVKIIALSAEPNFQLVRDFCIANSLDIEVVKLEGEESDSEEWIENEALIGCCRVALPDIRWTKNLFEIKNKFAIEDSQLVILTGSLGDTFLTTSFLKYRSKWRNKWWDKLRNWSGNRTSVFFEHLWRRGAQWQAIYHGILKESTSIPNYSAYHGGNVMEVLKKTDLEAVIDGDIRPNIGDYLLGRKVIYPKSNPSPTIWKKRKRFSSTEFFLETFKNKFKSQNDK